MANLSSEQRVWRELTQFHFNNNQIELILKKQLNSNTNNNMFENQISGNDTEQTGSCNSKDWKEIYHALRR